MSDEFSPKIISGLPVTVSEIISAMLIPVEQHMIGV